MDIPVGIICYKDTSAENAASSASPKLNPTRVGIILEGSIVMDTLTNLPHAICLLFGFTYALHLQYPKCLKNTFIFIQQVTLHLGQSELPPKVQKLKKLMILQSKTQLCSMSQFLMSVFEMFTNTVVTAFYYFYCS